MSPNAPGAQNALNPTLLAMLACPSDDHAPLREESHDGADTLVCTFCATRFPIDDGIPVLLLDDATPGPHGVGVAADGAGAPVQAAVAEPVGAVPAVEVADDEIVAADAVPGSPVDPRVSPKHALPDGVEGAAPVEDAAPLEVAEAAEVEGVFDTAEVERAAEDAELEAAEVVDVADVVEVADVLVDDDVAPETTEEPDVAVELVEEPEVVAEEPEVVAEEPDVAVEEPDVADEPAAETDAEPVADTSPPAAPTDPRRPQSPPPGARTLAAALRDRVERRLAEYEATRGPRRRRGTDH